MAAAAPSPSGRMLVNFSGKSLAVDSFDTGFIDVSAYAYFRISHTCADQTHQYIVYWSTTGKVINETITGAVKPAGTSLGTDVLTVQARFARFVLVLGGFPSDNAQLQAFFFDSLGAGSLKNLGVGAKIYSLSASGVRSVTSSDASLTVTESATEIDVTVAGGGSSLWEIGASPSILTQKTPATVNNFFFRSHDSGNEFYTTKSPVNNALLGGNYNYLDANEDNALVGGTYCVLRNQSTNVGSYCRANSIIGGIEAEISCKIGASLTKSERNVVVGFGGILSYNGGETLENGVFNSYSSAIAANTAGCLARGNLIVGGVGNYITALTAATEAGNCHIFGGFSNNITDNCSLCHIFGGSNLTITNLSGCTMIADDNMNTLAASANKQYTSRFSGGYRVYSNAAATTGMTMAAGGNSWVAVSDINKKENLQEVCYLDCLEGIANLPVYTYNFIGHTPRCIGPTAQDWNRIFPSTKDPLGIDQQDAIGISLAGIQGLVVWMKSLEERLNKLEGK